MAGAIAEDPAFCATRKASICLAQFVTADLMDQLVHLPELNLVSLTKRPDNETSLLLDAMDGFCTSFLDAMNCRNTGKWWECSKDVTAVKVIIEGLDNGLKPEWKVAHDKIEAYMRYANMICDKKTGLRQVLTVKQCIVDGSANASGFFRDKQVPRLNATLMSTNFSCKCCQAQQDFLDFMVMVNESCSDQSADDVSRFVSASFNLVPEYSSGNCPMNRSSVSESCDNCPAKGGDVIVEPDWCPKTRSPPDTYRCFTRSLKSDVLSKLTIFKDVTPISLLNLTEDELSYRVTVVKDVCKLLNATVG